MADFHKFTKYTNNLDEEILQSKQNKYLEEGVQGSRDENGLHFSQFDFEVGCPGRSFRVKKTRVLVRNFEKTL